MSAMADVPFLMIRNPFEKMLFHAPGLTRAGLAMALLILPLLLAQAIDVRTYNGINVWIKPTKFAASLSLYLLTLAYFAHFLPPRFLQRRWVQIYHGIVLFCIAAEMVWITGAAMAGIGSHFNTGSPLMGTLYGLMGVFAVTLTSATLLHGCAIWVCRRDRFARLVAASFVLTFVLTVPIAGYMAGQPGHHIGQTMGDAGGLWLMGWSREVGDLRVAHFFATHAMQVVPFAMATLLWAAGARLPRGTGFVLCAVFTALTLGTFIQALNGAPFLPMIGA